MAQSDQLVQNATFPSVRADINDNLAALFSQSSGNSAPSVTVAFQPWVDTSSSPPVWKVRNGSNTAWITVGVLDPAGFNAGGITAIANGGTGSTTAALALAALLPSQTGNAGKALVTSGSAATWTTVNAITSGTSVASTSGTAIDFIDIPGTVKRITVMFSGVSTNGTSVVQIQLGNTSFVTSGYSSIASGFASTGANTLNFTSGIVTGDSSGAAYTRFGLITVTNISGNTWVADGGLALPAIGKHICSGGVTLSGTLDRVRITTVNGTDTFDGGSINILYEG
jgi:hypothetical protein